MIDRLRFALAWLRWLLTVPGLGDPGLGAGAVRSLNRQILRQQHAARQPRLADFQRGIA